MAQPPPRKDAYSKFIANLHKEHFGNLQGKNQLELDLLDDISKFMKQKAAIEKTYAEGLLKLSSVYGSKKIASKVALGSDTGGSGDATDSNSQTVFQLWLKVLDENEKVANLRLAAAQVFQEKISDEAKNLRTMKVVKARKFVDRLVVVQKEVQESVTELDRARFVYYTEESECIKTAERAEEAQLIAKGKKKAMMSMFKSQTALEQQAEKLSAKQEELNIKSTGARNEYLLAIETANAHQSQYYKTWLKKCTECGVHGAVSEYITVLSATELATCNAQNASLSGIREICSTVLRHGSLDTAEQMVEYNYEPVPGDQVSKVLIPEQDAGINYALTKEAKEAAEKYNNSIKRITAFTKRKVALTKALKSGQDTSSLEEKIEEFDHSLNIAETEKAKALAKLNILREGGLPVDDYMEAEKPMTESGHGAAMDWEDDTDDHDPENQVSEVNYYSYDQISYGEPVQSRQPDPDWGQEDADPWGSSSPVKETPAPVQEEGKGYSGEVAQAVVLYNFDATGHDELTVREGEWINLLLSACNEEGWVMGQNSEDKTGLIPSSFVSQMTQEEYQAQLEAAASTMNDFEAATTNTTQEAAWPGTAAPPAPPVADLAIPSCPPPAMDDDEEETSSEEETDDSDDGGPPPGLAPPSGPPPPALSPPGPPAQPPSSPMSGDLGQYQAIYDFQAGAEDELSIAVGDVVLVKRPGDDEGWFFGSLNGKEGIFPSSYVEPYSNSDANTTNEALATETKKENVEENEDHSSQAASSDEEDDKSEDAQESKVKPMESVPSDNSNKGTENKEERKESEEKPKPKESKLVETVLPDKVEVSSNNPSKEAQVKGKPKEDSSDDSSATETDDSDDEEESNLR